MAKFFNVFFGGLILIAVLAVLFTKPNTSNVINSTGDLVSKSFTAAEAG